MPGPATPALEHFERAERWLRVALAAISAGFILLFLYTSLRRMAFPFSFDQIEGGMVTSVWRVAHGYPLYVKPNTDFVPYLYAPLYFYLAAALSKVVGAGYASLRLLSILGTVGSFAAIYAIIHGETKSRLAGIAGAGLFAACYQPLQGWFDLGRVDSLFVFLLLLAIYCTRKAPILVAVVVWLIAFQVKQTILPVAALVLCADWQRPRRMALGLIATLVGFGATLALGNHITGGWYSFYLFGTAKGLRWLARPAVMYIPQDLLQPFGLALLILLAAVLCAPPALRGRSTQFYLFVSFAIYASIWYLRAHAGSSVNTLVPAYAWTAVLFGLSVHRLEAWLATQPSSAMQLCRILLFGAATAQILGFLYHPGRFVPSAATREARQKFEQQLSSLPGDIYVLNHSYDAILADKKPHAVADAFGIIQESPPSPTRDAYMAEMHSEIDSHVFAGFVLDDTADTYTPGIGWMPADFLQQYPVRLLALSWSASVGGFNQPEEKWIYLPCSVLDHDTASFLTPDSVVNFGNCPNVLTLKR
ncbi:MAG: hypothetical protein M3O31_08795 [Acidobacteriota bacterium]|nr:hypothetical protein [Acidobacteriota bacterium]